jgi:myo-inositol 2-dehydrogenase / D-chiro-inositol 1-dehydrogenase
MAKDKVRIALIGAGRIGKLHGRTLAQLVPNATLAAVVDVNAEAARALAAELGVKAASSADEVFGDKSIDAVAIATATDTHAPLIIEAARAGKHIFCEKPLAADLGRIDEALAAVKKAGVRLMVGFNRRFDPNHARIKRAIQGGEIGTPHLLLITSRDPSPPPIAYVKVSGGIFFDMTIHDFDMARFLFGDVAEIYAAAGVLVDPAIGQAGDVDTAIITLKFASGAIGTIDNSRKAVYGYDQRVEAFGSKGSARSDNFFPNAVTLSTGASVTRDLPLNFFIERYTVSYQAELEAFARSVADGTETAVTGADGRAPVVMARAAALSYKENRPVKLAEIK